MTRIASLALIVCLAGLIAACGTRGPTTAERTALEEPARRLEGQGAYREAAGAWQRAATQLGQSDTANAYRLNAADALVKAGDTTAAQSAISQLPAGLPPDLAVRRALVAADISLLNGDAAAALSRVGPAIQTQDPALLARYRRTRSEALLLSGDTLGSVRELALLDAGLRAPQAIFDNRRRIWARLRDVDTQALSAVPATPPEPFSGWVELATLSRQFALDPDDLDGAVGQWSLRYPGHAAGEQIVPELLEQVRADAQPPSRVALLVPESGDLAAVGATIRDGFMTAWRTDAPNPRRPAVEVLDTHALGATAAYGRAVASGAQMIVGPLTKESVAAVLSGEAVPVTTVTLNYPVPAQDGSSTVPERAFIFALSPEDEAARVADLARAQGAEIAGILAPAGAWGERVSAAFQRHWESLGGTIAVVELFSDEPTSLSESVARLLNIEGSRERAKALRRAIGRRLEFNPKPRSDLDLLFVAAFPIEARQVKPLLAFHRASELPVLATSHVFSGSPDPDLDQDVEGVVFGDMPWLISPEIYGLPEQISSALPDTRGTLARLYAFGADAYALVGQLPKLRVGIDVPYPGLSGKLSLDGDQRVRRDLQWARFRSGIPVPIEDADALRLTPPADLEPAAPPTTTQ